MQSDQKLSPLKTKYALITDPIVLEKIRKQEEQELASGREALYIAPNETDETFDQEIISGQGHNLQKSSDEVGQLRAIEVAIWFDDPLKDSPNSSMRVHRRIINGRHRYRSVPEWRREYYDFSSFATDEDKLRPAIEYNLAKGHFDMQKKATRGERTVWVKNMCELGMKQGVTPTDCCNWVVKLAKDQGISNENSIREVCDPDFKNTEMSGRKKDKTFEKSGLETVETKKLKKVAGVRFQELEGKKIQLETENTQLQKEIIGLREDNTKRTNDMEEMQSKLRVMDMMSHPLKCECGIESEIKVDTTSGKVSVTPKK